MKKFKIFDFNRPGRGITKAQAQMESGTKVVAFIKAYFNKFWNLSSLNVLFVFANFPMFFAIAALSRNFSLTTSTPVSPLYAQLYGISELSGNPFTALLSSVIGAEGTLTVFSGVDKALLYLSLLVVFTYGLSHVGATYVLRGYTRGEPVFLISDFFHAIKKNFRQGVILGILDCLFTFALVYGLFLYYFYLGPYAINVMFLAELALFVLFLTMRFYMYNLCITFDLSIYKILKNSFILAIVGFKRNIVAWLGIIVVLIFSFYFLQSVPMLGVVLPILITFATTMFMSEFAAWENIMKFMVKPDGDKKIPASQSEPIFIDRG